MTREKYKKQWAHNWECVVTLIDRLHEQLPKEAPEWDDLKLLLYLNNLTQLQINIYGLCDFFEELREEDNEEED